ncbi:intercellular adhesion molecule 5 isoform X2 [Dicentrarchus labrax]|uniref:Ig-like domain-containing protein n=1 Tax=Dicentrarchus labrax TaxID=13489 RepID=A0A8P4KU69_DICLA|nr:intercellular adhesion molecule 5 isoform X2 [Dicentrarchus labrax]
MWHLRMLGHLMLIFLLCEADSTCPTESNPLTVHPPEVIGEYGKTVILNCTSTELEYEEMYWRSGTTTSEKEDELDFVGWSVPLSDWHVTAKCVIKLNNSAECSKDAEITVYKNPVKVNLFPTKHTNSAVVGRPYELQCDIREVAPVKNLIVRWYINNQIIKTDSFNNTSKTPVNTFSTSKVVLRKDQHGVQLRCEAQLDFGRSGPQLPAMYATYNVSVHYAPELRNNTDNDIVDVDEGDDVTLTCEAEGNPPPVFNWTRDGVNMLENMNNLSIIQVTSNATYSCKATNYLGNITKIINVRVIPRAAAPAAMPDPGATTKKGCPLVLMPAEAVVRFGDPVSVNCSTTDVAHFEGMGWEAPFGGTGFEKSSLVTWKVENLEEWTIESKCYVNLNDSQCSVKPDITVYKNPVNVDLFPTKNIHAAVEGKPYELRCDIQEVAPVKNLIVRWYINNQIIKTDSFNNTSKTPVNTFSTWKVVLRKDQHGAQLRCEAQLEFGTSGPQLPAMYATYNVSVHYAPELRNNTDNDIVDVDEGDDVTLTCEAEGNPPPVFNWTRDGVNMLENMNNLSIIQVTSNATYSCKATNYLGNITKIINVRVIPRAAAPAAMPDPGATTKKGCPLVLMPAEAVVRFGDPVSVNCSTTDVAHFEGMGWEATFGGTGFENSSLVTWKVEKVQEWTIESKCYVTLIDSQCSVKPDITVYKTPDAVTVSLDSSPMVEGTEYKLNCDIINVAPQEKLQVKWYKGSEMVHKQRFSDPIVTPVNVSSTLMATSSRNDDRALFKCVAELHLGPKGPELVPAAESSPYTAVVYYKPQIQNCPGSYRGVEHEFHMDSLICKADGNPEPTLQWYYQGKRINASEPLTRAQSGEYTAKFVNSLGSISTTVHITIEYPPSFNCDKSYEVQADGKLQNECVPQGEPKPDIIWYKDGKQMSTPQYWRKHDSGSYSLKATNNHGTANHMLYVDVLYAPVFRKGSYTLEVTLDANVTFDCHAEGNPDPVIRWNYTSADNVMETTGGRQKNISITGATSTNAGVYVCVATNKVGSVAKAVTLVMKGKTRQFPRDIIWILIIILILITITILIVLYCSRRKKQRKYSLVSQSMPMTTKANGVQA